VKLSTKGRYAVMAIVDLASMKADRPVPLADIAERQDISLSYLEQLFSKMKRGGVVRSVRGPGGGYILAKSRDAISVTDILRSVDDETRMGRCVPSSPNLCRPGDTRCATHELWAMLSAKIEAVLDQVSIADVCEGRYEFDNARPIAKAVGED
jgi:Rrf2 family iron-sulfur cluster assembly transcriptional regulator